MHRIFNSFSWSIGRDCQHDEPSTSNQFLFSLPAVCMPNKTRYNRYENKPTQIRTHHCSNKGKKANIAQDTTFVKAAAWPVATRVFLLGTIDFNLSLQFEISCYQAVRCQQAVVNMGPIKHQHQQQPATG